MVIVGSLFFPRRSPAFVTAQREAIEKKIGACHGEYGRLTSDQHGFDQIAS